MNSYLHQVVFSLPILFIMQVAPAQQVPARSVLNSPRPLVDAARRLQEAYGKVVTYEEPVLTWRGDLEAMPGRNPEGKWTLFPKRQSFVLPKIRPDADLASVLDNTVAAYDQQTSGTRFQVLSSKWGYHIVSVQAHDENGRYVRAVSALDQIQTSLAVQWNISSQISTR